MEMVAEYAPVPSAATGDGAGSAPPRHQARYWTLGCICITLHPMTTQTTFRLPTTLARALARQARERGVPKSQLVREALEQYLAEGAPPTAGLVRERTLPYMGALQLDLSRISSDPGARLIRDRNWRQ